MRTYIVAFLVNVMAMYEERNEDAERSCLHTAGSESKHRNNANENLVPTSFLENHVIGCYCSVNAKVGELEENVAICLMIDRNRDGYL